MAQRRSRAWPRLICNASFAISARALVSAFSASDSASERAASISVSVRGSGY